MKVAMIGMGKLGFPVALAWASRGHEVVGYDVSPKAKEILETRTYPHAEAEVHDLLATTTLRIVDAVEEAVAHADLVFVAVQTPHRPKFEGVTRMPKHRADFDYVALRLAVAQVGEAAQRLKKHVVLVVISTVLPGTSDRDVLQHVAQNPYVSYVYSPMFIAMSTVVPDALNPEFVLIGVDKSDARGVELVKSFFETLHPIEKLRFMSVASAELTKVAYNVFLGLKIVAANTIMEIAHKTGANADEVSDALARATDRVVSPKYMRGGMGDGGGCHPRDQIALSWLAQDLDLSYDLCGAMVEARERQTEWLADLARAEAMARKLPIVVLGRAYKRDTSLTAGSPAMLLANLLREWIPPGVPSVEQWDPFVDATVTFDRDQPAVYVIATDHQVFYAMAFPEGSVVIDPWGQFGDRPGVKVIRVGRP